MLSKSLGLLTSLLLTSGCAAITGWSATLPDPHPASSAPAPATPSPAAPSPAAPSPAATTPTATAPPASQVLIQAHQGGGGLTIAGTAKQFRKIARTDVYMVEFDAQITRDGVIVINHSDQIMDLPGRVCNHHGLRIHTVTYAKVTQVRCAGEPLATFQQVLDTFRGTDIRLNVEIKAWDNHSTQPDASLRAYGKQIVSTLDAGGFEGRYILSFFDWRVLLPTVRKMHPDLYVIALERSSRMKQPSTRMYQAVRDAAALGADAFEPDLPVTQEGLLDFVKAQGMDPQLWYVNTPEDVRFALAHGINPISTDFPVMAKDVISEAASATLVPKPERHRVSPRSLLSATLRPGRMSSLLVFGWGRVPLSAQAKLAVVEFEVSTTSPDAGSLTMMPRGGDAATATTVALEAGATTTKVLVSPGDLGQVTVTTTTRATVRVRLVGYRTAAYTLKS